MKSWTTKQGTTVLRVLTGPVNAYLVRTNQRLILVDTGVASAFNRLQKNLESVMEPEEQLDMLVLTHSHYDHCQNAAKLKDKYQCSIVLGAQEAHYTRQGHTPLPRGTFWLTRGLTALGNRIGARGFGYDNFSPDILIDEDRLLDSHLSGIKAIKTSGHTVGSISLIVDQEVAIVGDALFGIFRKSIYPPFADDTKTMIASWGKLLETGCSVFLPGHGRAVQRKLLQNKYNKQSRS